MSSPRTSGRRARTLAGALLLLSCSTTPAAAGDREPHWWPSGVPVAVLRRFDGPAVPWAAGHRGVDLALPAGRPVRASAGGTVAFAGVVVDRPVVSVDHAGGTRTTYEPVVPVVRAGEPVRRGQVIGVLAPGGHCGSPCLHWGARRGPDRYLDPLTLLGGPVRLLPL